MMISDERLIHLPVDRCYMLSFSDLKQRVLFRMLDQPTLEWYFREN